MSATRHKKNIRMSATYRAKQYLHYLLTAGYWRGHRIHSPFAFELVNTVINSPHHFYHFADVEHYRRRLLADRTVVAQTDFGAAGGALRRRTVAELTSTAAVSRRYGRLLTRLVARFRPRTMVELGTSLGIGTLYMALAATEARVLTLEGCPVCAGMARKAFADFGLTNVEVLTGPFDSTLPAALASLPAVDFAFVDGDHTLDATMRHFEALAARATDGSVFVFDDIHHSPQMTEAWRRICADPRTVVTVDLFRMGLVFFRSGCQKQHYVVRW